MHHSPNKGLNLRGGNELINRFINVILCIFKELVIEKNRFANKQPKMVKRPNPFYPDQTTREQSQGHTRLSLIQNKYNIIKDWILEH